jgi:hypothetical protein
MRRQNWSIAPWCIVVLVTIAGVILYASQPTDLARVSWHPEHPITWDLFQGAPPQDASQKREAAAIHMTLQWSASYEIRSSSAGFVGRVATVSVTNTMEPQLSLVVPGKQSDRLLHHEQIHFDLNEVYRRRIEACLLSIGSCQTSTQQEAIEWLDRRLHQVANGQLDRLESTHSLYDAQTSHGTNLQEQRRWDEQIREWLVAPASAP